MPRQQKPKTTTTLEAVDRQWYDLHGEHYAFTLADWDPDTNAVCQALLELVADGLTVVMRPGSGGRAVGVAIWRGDVRPPARWFGDHDELNEWARGIVEAAAQRRARITQNGA